MYKGVLFLRSKVLQVNLLGWNIILGTLFSGISVSMSVPFLSIYLTQVKQVSPSTTGLIVASSSLVGILISFYGGALSDFFGRKKVMLTSVFAWSLVFIGFSLANSIISFFIINVFNGICQSIFGPASRALLSDISKKENRLIMFNLRYTAANIGVIFGPFLGIKLGAGESTFPFLLAGLTYFLYGLSLIYSFYKTNINLSNKDNKKVKVSTSLSVIRKDRVFLITLLGIILSISGYAHFTSTLPLYFANTNRIEEGVKVFSLFLSLNAIVIIIVQYPVINFMKRFSPLNSIIIGNLFISFSLLAFSFTTKFITLMLIVILFSIGELLIYSMIDLLIDVIAKPNLKGTYFGALGFSRLGNVMAPWLGGLLFNYFGFNEPLYTFIILSLVTLSGIPALLFAKFMNKQNLKTILEYGN